MFRDAFRDRNGVQEIGQGVIVGQTYATGAALITQYQRVYAKGVLLSDGVMLGDGVPNDDQPSFLARVR